MKKQIIIMIALVLLASTIFLVYYFMTYKTYNKKLN